jgi:hypothetical protein
VAAAEITSGTRASAPEISGNTRGYVSVPGVWTYWVWVLVVRNEFANVIISPVKAEAQFYKSTAIHRIAFLFNQIAFPTK